MLQRFNPLNHNFLHTCSFQTTFFFFCLLPIYNQHICTFLFVVMIQKPGLERCKLKYRWVLFFLLKADVDRCFAWCLHNTDNHLLLSLKLWKKSMSVSKTKSFCQKSFTVSTLSPVAIIFGGLKFLIVCVNKTNHSLMFYLWSHLWPFFCVLDYVPVVSQKTSSH